MRRTTIVLTLATALTLIAIQVGPGLASRLHYAADMGAAMAARSRLSQNGDIQLATVFRDVAKSIGPSVVNVSTTSLAGRDGVGDLFGDDLMNRFFGQRNDEQRSLGTGVIIKADGVIITNNHVVRGGGEITVTLHDRRRLPARLLGADPKTDIAVLKVDATDLLPAVLGDSDRIEVGDWVLASGNPFGLTHTVTSGIISAKGRSNMGISDYEDFIQTDAAINPGNSGGPLVDLAGQVIGINTAIASRTGGSMGIGFAIPSNMVARVVDGILDGGQVRRGWMGVSIQTIDSEMAKRFGFDRDGVLIADVTPDGPAARAGIRARDILYALADREINDSNQLRSAVATLEPGESVEAKVFRDGAEVKIELVVGELDESSNGARGKTSGGR